MRFCPQASMRLWLWWHVYLNGWVLEGVIVFMFKCPMDSKLELTINWERVCVKAWVFSNESWVVCKSLKYVDFVKGRASKASIWKLKYVRVFVFFCMFGWRWGCMMRFQCPRAFHATLCAIYCRSNSLGKLLMRLAVAQCSKYKLFCTTRDFGGFRKIEGGTLENIRRRNYISVMYLTYFDREI